MTHCPICSNELSGKERVCPVCGHNLAGMQLSAGTKLMNGRYTIGKVLGQGGFGITYKGADTFLNRTVAIKELFPEGASRHITRLIPPTSYSSDNFQETLERFLDEARTMARFTHPAIVRVWDAFEENGTAYLVMELLKGETVGGAIGRQGRLSVEETRRIGMRTAEGLAVVHENALLHRDIKPDNIYLTEDGRVVLIDFGSARDFAGNQTRRHTRLVTPGYAPPEQYATEAKFGPYTDIYALSATLYHALMGEQPPQATDRMLGTPVKPLPANIPSSLRAAIEEGLALRIDERPANVERFLEVLHREARPQAQQSRTTASSPPVRTVPKTPAPPPRPPRPRTQVPTRIPTPAPAPRQAPSPNPAAPEARPNPIAGAALNIAFFFGGLVALLALLSGEVEIIQGLLTGAVVGIGVFVAILIFHAALPFIGLIGGGYVGNEALGVVGILFGGFIGYLIGSGIKRAIDRR